MTLPRRTRLRAQFEPYLYAGPAVIAIGLTLLVPLAIGLSYAFRNMNILELADGSFVGAAHFEKLWDDADFWHALNNTVTWTIACLVLQFLLGLGLALLLNRPFLGKRLVQAVVFLPWAVPAFLSGLNWAWLFNPVVGPVPHWLAWAGIMETPFNILSDERTALWGPVIANVWFGIPFFAITLLAALQSIPDDLYEAASIDGASPLKQFWHVTLPFLAPTIAITILLRTIWIANFGDFIWVMTYGGPANASQILATYVFSTAYTQLDFGYASAIASVLLVLLMIYAAVIFRMRRALLAEG
jgi:multiple sugar transport system permease protein